ncbi:MAG: HAMP domain-containing histidine kinase [Bacteroidetes bacterium]|nr:HAMP domain-containing histidine kinase [Bacteroidota bacterium]MBU1373460.1 HAMP domain-containing histidine kinase [Bacteroidota bacterium]MBU1485218.1 HAMP domain-containing histidine kinase [Bacteroidota bacterium]MBU1761409.1 HAMP domain-containing histidine kinase [Bacteroidota bacterium]MBU2045482.1 HAMP domain-containing histidine kinase [Bacteroidota bacterium]
MNPYEKKRRWKYLLLFFAVVIASSSLWYTDFLVTGISKSERTRAEIWSQSFKKLFNTDNDEMMNYLFTVRDSLTVSVIVTNEKDSIMMYTALDSTKTYYKVESDKVYDPKYFLRELKRMKAQHEPILIDFEGKPSYYKVYYKDSDLLTQLRIFPYIQLTVIAAFLFIAYYSFSSARRSEQNQVWVGLAKETAHQLGTPISSLMAWTELLKDKFNAEQDPLILQMENDVKRLEIVADRFSKIGSKPVLTRHSVHQVVTEYVDYFKVRVSDKIQFSISGDEHQEAFLNIPLFDWVIENILKNAVNAIEGEGQISINIEENIVKEQIFVDITDSGKGIPRSKFDAIFQPGFTTRKRGWGLGLSLTKRIIENYHRGQIFVKESEIGKGTTFRIIIKSSLNYVPTLN